jgi:hypothetical protein
MSLEDETQKSLIVSQWWWGEGEGHASKGFLKTYSKFKNLVFSVHHVPDNVAGYL